MIEETVMGERPAAPPAVPLADLLRLPPPHWIRRHCSTCGVAFAAHARCLRCLRLAGAEHHRRLNPLGLCEDCRLVLAGMPRSEAYAAWRELRAYAESSMSEGGSR